MVMDNATKTTGSPTPPKSRKTCCVKKNRENANTRNPFAPNERENKWRCWQREKKQGAGGGGGAWLDNSTG